MLDRFHDIVVGFGRTIRLADFFDVLIVATILYLVFMWLRASTSDTTSRRATVVLMLFIAVSLLARLYDMYLFQRLMQVFGLVLLIAAVVIFQSDIRRMLDRIGTWGIFRPAASTSEISRTIDIITEAATHLARSRTGALIAIRGREPWDHHIQGGVELQGLVSQPILYSIFDPDTPGHDGVVLIEGNRITRFAAHLPLASNLPEASKFGGTRHAAALGLAEVSDAIVVIVSEERGTISVAEAGKLHEVDSASGLKNHLESFWKKNYTKNSAATPVWWSKMSLKVASVSLTLAVLLWMQFAYSYDTITRTFEVPVVFRNLPENWEVIEAGPLERKVSVTGSEQAMQFIEPSDLAIYLDMSKPQEGLNEIVATRDHLRLPPGIRLNQIDQSVIRVNARSFKPIRIPVEVRVRDMVPDSFSVVSISPLPDTITLLAPSTVDRVPAQVLTSPVALSSFNGSRTVATSIEIPSGFRLPHDAPSEIMVNILLEKKSVNLTKAEGARN